MQARVGSVPSASAPSDDLLKSLLHYIFRLRLILLFSTMSAVELRVELPAYSYSFHVHVEPSWSILNVKEEIKRACPGSPQVDGQRVIWRGRLLRDEEKVQDVWKVRVLCSLAGSLMVIYSAC